MGLFRAVFRALEDAPLTQSETLCQLYEIHLALKSFHQESYSEYELDEDTARSIRSHYKKHQGGGRNPKPERSSERLHGDVGALLKDLLDVSVSANHVTSLGLSVDLHAAARSRRSSSSTPVAS